MKKHILIIEDSKDIQILLSSLLQSLGYTMTCANNGQEALELLNTSKYRPGLILLDLMMPVMDGYGFRIEQKKNPDLANIPVVVMTAGGDVQAKAVSVGASDYLKKPFTDVETILQTVDRFF
jgi:CheY-like chemotaxis protein